MKLVDSLTDSDSQKVGKLERVDFCQETSSPSISPLSVMQLIFSELHNKLNEVVVS